MLGTDRLDIFSLNMSPCAKKIPIQFFATRILIKENLGYLSYFHIDQENLIKRTLARKNLTC